MSCKRHDSELLLAGQATRQEGWVAAMTRGRPPSMLAFSTPIALGRMMWPEPGQEVQELKAVDSQTSSSHVQSQEAPEAEGGPGQADSKAGPIARN